MTISKWFVRTKPNAFIPVKGGLGNQMFFIAFAELMKLRGYSVKFVWHEYLITTQHNGVEVFNCFNIPCSNFTKITVSIFLFINNLKIPTLIKKIIYKIVKLRYSLCRKLKQASPYSAGLSSISAGNKSIYLDGFWQNLEYINSEAINYFELFKFETKNNSFLKSYSDNMACCNSVSIHIRRGDYLSKEFANLKVIDENIYFRSAIKYIKRHVENPIFYIFTDDFPWVKNNIFGDDIVYVEGNRGKDSYFDMYLMSLCQHNIISNSSFSFWGAFLNKNTEKIVVAPDCWAIDVSSRDLWSPEWIYLCTC